MSRKVSASKAFDNVPPLAIYYQDANKRVFGTAIYVQPKLYTDFTVMECDLRYCDVSSMDYANVVVAALKKWAQRHGMNFVPAKIFLSNFAVKTYARIRDASTVNVVDSDNREELLYSECMVLKHYISDTLNLDKVVRLKDVVQQLEPVLSKDWLEVYHNRGNRYTEEAIQLVAGSYGLKNVNTLNELITAILKERCDG